MSKTVQIDGDHAIFPGEACVHCLRPVEDRVSIYRVKHSTVRRVSVPFCAECLDLREQKSPTQVQAERIATVVSFVLSWIGGVWVYTQVLAWPFLAGERECVWAILLGVLAVVILFGVLYLFVRPLSEQFRSPETQAVLDAVKIRDFDWDTTTLEFADEEYAERFALVNPRETQA